MKYKVCSYYPNAISNINDTFEKVFNRNQYYNSDIVIPKRFPPCCIYESSVYYFKPEVRKWLKDNKTGRYTITIEKSWSDIYIRREIILYIECGQIDMILFKLIWT